VLQEQAGRVVARATYVGTPLHAAGIDAGDVIVSLDGVPLTSTDQLAEIAARHRSGDAVPVTFTSRGQTLSASWLDSKVGS